MIVKTLTTGAAVVTTFDLNYLPQEISWVAATALTSLKVNVLGVGEIVDLDADGLASLGKAQPSGGLVTNGYTLQLADGYIPGRTVTFTFTNSASQTPDIYARSFARGTGIVYNIQQKILAASATTFQGEQFDRVSFENGTVATDDLEVQFASNDTRQKLNLEELKFIKGNNFALANSDEDYIIYNLGGEVINFTYIPTNDTVLYLQRFLPFN